MADVTLKPCPFCGSPGELEHGNDHHGNWFNLGCSDHWGKRTDGLGCKAGRLWYTETDTPEADAIAAWNTRPAPSPSDVETEALLLDYDKALIVAARNLDPAALSKPTFAELRSAVLARMRGAAVPDELMSALATLFHGYCRLEDGDQKFAMVVPPDWTWQGRHPSDCVKAWAVVCDTVYPAAPEVPR